MFNKITPEQAGISSRYIKKFIEALNRRGLATHSVLLMRGNNIFAEYYWAPFKADTPHRMYSETKSYVAVAIGLLIEDGKLSLDDKLSELFPEKYERELPENLKSQTVKDMLTMCTVGQPPWWFANEDPDRTHLYMEKNNGKMLSGMRFSYDSPGSQVLSSLVEKLSGMSLFDFLSERIFRHLGTFKTATILKCPNGDCWGDSALVCTPRDMASFGRFVMNYGTWNGKRLMSKEWLKEATSKVVDNQEMAFDDFYTQGYGYQIWRLPENAFSFNGMGAQLTVCIPDKDLIFVITSDDQGFVAAKSLILSAFYEIIYDNLGDEPLPEDKTAFDEAVSLKENLKLVAMSNSEKSDLWSKLNKKVYLCNENRTGITRFSFEFENETKGVFKYENAQGEKEIPFGVGYNIFDKFPQLGYSDDFGGVPTTNGFKYDCAASAAFRDDNKLLLRVQIIDRYFGNMFARFSFKDDFASVTMTKTAEAFLDEYHGEFIARLKN